MIQLFNNPKIPKLTMTNDELEDLLSWGGYKSNNYFYVKNIIVPLEYIKRNNIDTSLGVFESISDREILIKYIMEITKELYLDDTDTHHISDSVSCRITNGVCYLTINTYTYIITYEQYCILIGIEKDFREYREEEDCETLTLKNICPYCRDKIDSFTHKNICELIRTV